MASLFGRREYGPHPTIPGVVLHGQWVVRDIEGNFVDNDKYRADLESRLGPIAFLENDKLSWVGILDETIKSQTESRDFGPRGTTQGIN